MTRSHTRRKRELARMKAERAAERAEARRRRRRAMMAVGAGSLVVVVAGTLAAFALTGGGSSATAASATPKATPSATASAKPTVAKGTTSKVGTCVYTADGTAPAKAVALPKAAPTVDKSQVTAVITTNYGPITATLYGDKAPCTVHAFETLVAAKYFDNTSCHRQTSSNIYVLQCGDPTGTGNGGPGFTYANENVTGVNYDRGVLAMANTGQPNTNGSQFFINYKNPNADGAKALAGGYTVFGKVTKGLDVLDKITAKGITGGGTDGAPASKPKILSFTITQP